MFGFRAFRSSDWLVYFLVVVFIFEPFFLYASPEDEGNRAYDASAGDEPSLPGHSRAEFSQGDEFVSPDLNPPVSARERTEAERAFEENIGSLQALFESGSQETRHRLDTFRVLQQEARVYREPHPRWGLMPAPEKIRLNQHLELRLFNAEGLEIGAVNFLEADSRSFEGAESFQILFRGEPIHEFYIPVRSAFFSGTKLLFQDRDSYNSETKTHFIGFIDLGAYREDLSRAPLPIFHFPVREANSEAALSSRGGKLFVGSQEIGDRETSATTLLDTVSQIHQVSVSISVSLSDPSTYENAGPMVEDFGVYLEKSRNLEAAATDSATDALFGRDSLLIQSLTKSMAFRRALGPANEERLPALGEEEGSRLRESAELEKQIQESLRNVVETKAEQRRLGARIRWMLSYMSAPRESAGGKLREALAFVASGFKRSSNGAATLDPEELAKQRTRKYLRWGVGAATAAGLAVFFPEQTAGVIHSGLSLSDLALTHTLGSVWEGSRDFSLSVMDGLASRVTGTVQMAWESMKATFAFIDGNAVMDMYVRDGRWSKLMVGLTAAFGVLSATVFVPHLVINSWKLRKDLRADERGPQGSFSERLSQVASSPIRYLRNLRARVVDRQNVEEQTFLDRLVPQVSENDEIELTAEQSQQLEEKIAKVEKSDLGLMKRLGKKLGFKAKDDHKLKGIWSAVAHFLFSSASFTNSGAFYAKVWNGWFTLRSFVWKPTLWTTMLYYPNYLSTALGPADQQGTIPTHWNGGLRPVFKEYYLRAMKRIGSDRLDRLRAYEQKLIEAEKRIHAEVLRKTVSALVEFVDKEEDARRIFELGGIGALTDKRIQQLPFKVRQYFKVYYMMLFDESMRLYVQGLAKSAEEPLSAMDQMNDRQLLDAVFSSKIEADALLDRAGEIVATAAEEGQIAEKAESKLHWVRSLPERVFEGVAKANPVIKNGTLGIASVDFRGIVMSPNLRAYTVMDPRNNPQTARRKAVIKQMNNPQAMARAVRSVKASLIVDKPLELMLMFLMLAGVTEGMMVPLHDEMFSDNSVLYLGRYPFLTSYVVGIMMSVMADIWYKLQVDELHEGHFDDVPRGQDAKRTFLGWYWKKFTQKSDDPGKDNSWWNNHRHYLKLIWANMPAALATSLAIYLPTLGRFDVDVYVTGYLVAYFAPFSGLSMKIEQAFDMASYWYARHFTDEELKDRRVQRYINGRIQDSRYGFNFIYKFFYENPLGFFLENMETLPHPVKGGRGWARVLFGGFTPTEWAVGFLDKVKVKLGFVPGIEALVDMCDSLITNKYTDGARLDEMRSGSQ